jgi:RNA polymerase sigma-70 factor (ECF subfamily)
MVYCVVPEELAAKLHEPLRRHFAENSGVEVVVEQRWRDRRRRDERRVVPPPAAPAAEDRRRIPGLLGRRVAERRASWVALSIPGELPRVARSYADLLRFVERIVPSEEQIEDQDTARLVVRFQAGETDVFRELYLRYFDRVYAYIRVALRDTHAAEDLTQQIFLRLFEALPRYERRAQPFRAWLFRIVRNGTLDILKSAGRIEPVDPMDLRIRDQGGTEGDADALPALNWISDRELAIFIDRLPVPQRQALILRYMVGMSNAEIANVLKRSEADVRKLQSRALSFLRERLIGVGRTPKGPAPRARLRRRVAPANVARARRFVLLR